MRLIPALILFVSYPLAAIANTTIRPELRLSFGGLETRPKVGVVIYVAKPLNQHFGVSTWVQAEEGWAEGYGGLTFAPAESAEFSLSLGMEQAAAPWRVAASAWFGAGLLTSLTIMEMGGSGLWYQSVNLLKANDSLKIGLMLQRFAGLGPRVDVQLTKDIRLWVVNLVYDIESGATHPVAFRLGCAFTL